MIFQIYTGPYRRPTASRSEPTNYHLSEHGIDMDNIEVDELVAIAMLEYKERPCIARVKEVDITEHSVHIHWQGGSYSGKWKGSKMTENRK